MVICFMLEYCRKVLPYETYGKENLCQVARLRIQQPKIIIDVRRYLGRKI